MALPIAPPLKPMLAKLARTIPDGDGWLYEPKWDGFRCIVFRDGDAHRAGEPQGQPVHPLLPRAARPAAGEPARPQRRRRRDRRRRPRGSRSRLRRPAAAHPPGRVAGAPPGRRDAGVVHRLRPAGARRRVAARPAAGRAPAAALLRAVRPATAGAPHAGEHRRRRGRRVVRALRGRRPRRRRRQAPRRAVPAGQAGARQGQARAHRGLRRRRLPHPQGRQRRRLAAARAVRRRGPAAARRRGGVVQRRPPARAAGRAGAVDRTTPSRATRGRTGPSGSSRTSARKPGATSRWNAGKDLSWVPIRTSSRDGRVAEVTFGQLENRRFRHGVSFVRWRPDREPISCRYDQLDVAEPVPFEDLVRSCPAAVERRAVRRSETARRRGGAAIDAVVAGVPWSASSSAVFAGAGVPPMSDTGTFPSASATSKFVVDVNGASWRRGVDLHPPRAGDGEAARHRRRPSRRCPRR